MTGDGQWQGISPLAYFIFTEVEASGALTRNVTLLLTFYMMFNFSSFVGASPPNPPLYSHTLTTSH